MELYEEINRFYYAMSLFELKTMNENEFYNGLSYNSMLYLNVIEQIENCTVSKIAEALNITKPSVTSKINELVAKGAVQKVQSDADKRIFYLRLSPKILQTFSIYTEIFRNIETLLRKKFTSEQIRNFCDIFASIADYDWSKVHNGTSA